MDFDNPDNRMKIAGPLVILTLALFIAGIWLDDGRWLATGGVITIPAVAVAMWAAFGYEDEDAYDKRARKEAKANKGLDKSNEVW